MPLVRVLQHWGDTQDGDILDMTNAETLVAEGKAEYVTQQEAPVLAPVTPELPVTPEPPVTPEGTLPEGADEPQV